MTAFPFAQPDYEAHKIACFPVDREHKKPSIKAPDKIGLKASRQLAFKFPSADALGFWAGSRNRITVLDVDVPGKAGERILGDLGNRHGHSRFIVRTSGGKFHAYYRNDNEPRIIRLYGKDGPAVDLLGSGLVIAAPSRMTKGSYEIIHGCMDDLDRLEKLHDLPGDANVKEEKWTRNGSGTVHEGERNRALFSYCLRMARHCDDLQALIDEARSFCEDAMIKTLSEAEIVRTAKSAWGYEERGENWAADKHGGSFRMDLLKRNLDAFGLYTFIRYHNSRRERFVVANAVHRELGWALRRLQSARAFLIEIGCIVEIEPATTTSPATYGWGRIGGCGGS